MPGRKRRRFFLVTPSSFEAVTFFERAAWRFWAAVAFLRDEVEMGRVDFRLEEVRVVAVGEAASEGAVDDDDDEPEAD